MYWDESVRSSLRPLKHCCHVNPAVLPETTDPNLEFDYIDIGSVSLSEGITHKERMRFAASPSRARKPVQEGDIVVSTVRTYLRAIAAIEPADTPQVASTGFAVLRAKKGTDSRFLYRIVQSNPFVEKVVSQSTGVSYPAINPTTLSNIEVPLPDLATQRQIADFLDRETARIDLLIEKKQRLVDMVAPRFEALIHKARKTGEWRRFGFCAKESPRPIPQDREATFVPLGLCNRGRGLFRKPETAYDDLGDSSFFFVEEDDLVFSGQFAWEGAVGFVSDREHGCVVSHRYPVYTGIKGVLSAYLFAYFRSHHGQFLMDNCSRGAAGRNRPLNTRILEKEKIPVPNIGLQERIATVIAFERRLKEKTAPSIDRLKEYRAALITAAVTGQIDVQAYARSGIPDRHLDAIQEEMSA